MAEHGWHQYKQGAGSLDSYYIRRLPAHLQAIERWDDLADLLCDLEYIQTKCAAKLTYELIEDYKSALQEDPDNAENIRKEKERKARMKKYTSDLIAYAKGDIKILDIPKSIEPWSDQKKKERIKAEQKQLEEEERQRKIKEEEERKRKEQEELQRK